MSEEEARVAVGALDYVVSKSAPGEARETVERARARLQAALDREAAKK